MTSNKMYDNQPWCKQATLGAADATKTIMAAPGAGKALVVMGYVARSLTAAAQVVDLEDTSGTVEIARFGVSWAVNSQADGRFEEGIELTANEALIAKPAAAGPSIHFVAWGYVKSKSATT